MNLLNESIESISKADFNVQVSQHKVIYSLALTCP